MLLDQELEGKQYNRMQQQALYHTSNEYSQREREVEGGTGGRGGREEGRDRGGWDGMGTGTGEGTGTTYQVAERKTYQPYLQPDSSPLDRSTEVKRGTHKVGREGEEG